MMTSAHFVVLRFAEDGKIVAVKSPDPYKSVSDVDVAEAVAESVEITMNSEDEKSA
jgi:hypothetical protein